MRVFDTLVTRRKLAGDFDQPARLELRHIITQADEESACFILKKKQVPLRIAVRYYSSDPHRPSIIARVLCGQPNVFGLIEKGRIFSPESAAGRKQEDTRDQAQNRGRK